MMTRDPDGHIHVDRPSGGKNYMAIRNKKEKEGDFIAYTETTRVDEQYQLWDVIYADEAWPGDCKTGQWDRTFGWICDTEF